MNEQVTEYIENAPDEQKEIMSILRALIHQKVKDVSEEFKWSRPIFKSTKDFAYFQSNKSYVTFGLTKDIEKLNDPKKVLEGSGKTMRHIKVKKAIDIDRESISEWLEAITSE